MKSTGINFGIGFVTGRANVCNVINNYYQNILEQLQKVSSNINVTIFILYDTSYQNVDKKEFYKIHPEVYKNINIEYITQEDIEEEKKILKGRYGCAAKEINTILGYGHAMGRNTVMYFALKNKMDYLLFWDDDEYPLACIKGENGEIIWKKQDNIVKHLENIKNADVSIGYHCGYISPIPYVKLNDEISEMDFKKYIEAISNEIIDWQKIKNLMQIDNGVTYANPEIANGIGKYELGLDNSKKWVSGSTLCINLKHIDVIPAFYNPPGARGEDTFFSMMLDNCKVIKVPVYHFHDGFLKYKSLMNDKFPKKLRKIETKEENVEERFLKASVGWLKYKPLLLYIQEPKKYNEKIQTMKKNLEISVPKMNDLFKTNCFNKLNEILELYDQNVKKHYKAYVDINKFWNNIKFNISKV